MLDLTYSTLPSPNKVKKKHPLENTSFIEKARTTAKDIFDKKDDRLALIVGPCSIHCEKEALEYALELDSICQKAFYPIMRVYFEKPRTTLGWKGFLYDPNLDGSYDFEEGIVRTRKLLLQLAKKNIPCATEFLDPMIAPYIDDLITWGFIGARTTASQPHRMLSSTFPFPVGFKNAVDGNVDLAVQGAFVAKNSHVFPGIDPNGKISKLISKGNPYSHIVLRGSNSSSNHHPAAVQDALRLFEKYPLTKRIIIDCAHGNSQKCSENQKQVFKEIIHQIFSGNSSIMGIMLESNINKGAQSINSENLKHGVSVTDPCISLEETKQLILWAESFLEEGCLAL